MLSTKFWAFITVDNQYSVLILKYETYIYYKFDEGKKNKMLIIIYKEC